MIEAFLTGCFIGFLVGVYFQARLIEKKKSKLFNEYRRERYGNNNKSKRRN